MNFSLTVAMTCVPVSRTFAPLVVASLVVVFSSRGVEGVDRKQTKESTADRFQLALPVTSVGLKETLLQISVKTQTAFGVEIAAGIANRLGPRDPAKSGPRLEFAVDLRGMTVPAMLDRITSVKDTTAGLYEWTQDAGYSVRPAGFRNNRAVALSRVISRVEISRANLIELLVDVQRLFDETYGRRPQSPKHMPARVRPSIERPVSLSMTNVSVRAILNEIMRQHGRMSWLAEYADPAGGHRGLKLSFVGFDNWTVSATARTR